MAKVELNTAAPDFSMLDFDGTDFRLSDLTGSRNALLVFNRGFV